MTYTGNITYFEPEGLYDEGVLRFGVGQEVCQEPSLIMPGNPMYTRAREDFNQEAYMYPAPPVHMGTREIDMPEEDLYLLRFLIKQPGSDFTIPQKIQFLQGIIEECARYQMAHFPDYEDRFVYLTVRSGELKSVNEDQFHVDGFQGISVPRHIPEQNYIWANCYPTLMALQPYFMEQLDPALHNMHDYFHEKTSMDNVYAGRDRGLYIIDPYHVHARPMIPDGTLRSFFRLCFSPAEIRDDTNTVNEHLPRGPYNREDIRNHLGTYQEPEGVPNSSAYGLSPIE